jgi:hypothetical protein
METNTELLKSLLPIFIALLTLIGGGIVYNVQKSVDRSNQMRAERRDLYRKLVRSFHNFVLFELKGTNASIESDLLEFRSIEAEIIVCAPDHVVKAIKGLSSKMALYAAEYLEKNEKREAFNELKDTYKQAVAEMRKDVLGSTSISSKMIGEILSGFTASIKGANK